ncbi:hypothetical protein R1sor_026342 [Riccia sorocarpa]|uniref:Uncharacterized protein n=1 Tax=Riccia sorocarpa TaxID=122646 RepID=A0ABD3GD67_9MARC
MGSSALEGLAPFIDDLHVQEVVHSVSHLESKDLLTESVDRRKSDFDASRFDQNHDSDSESTFPPSSPLTWQNGSATEELATTSEHTNSLSIDRSVHVVEAEGLDLALELLGFRATP